MWFCVVCTLENDDARTICEVCATPKIVKAQQSLLCNSCHEEIKPGCPLAQISSKQYHQSCFVCSACGQFAATLNGAPCTVKVVEGSLFHTQCIAIPEVLCDVCQQSLKGDPKPLVTLWGQKVCSHHRMELKKLCCFCGFMSPSTPSQADISVGVSGIVPLPDGRYICSFCLSTEVSSPADLHALVEEVFQFVRSQGLKIEKNFPIRVTSSLDMLKAAAVASGFPLLN